MHPHSAMEDQHLATKTYRTYVQVRVDDRPQSASINPAYYLGQNPSQPEGFESLLGVEVSADLERLVVNATIRIDLGKDAHNISPYMTGGVQVSGTAGLRPLFDAGRYVTLYHKCFAPGLLTPAIPIPDAPTYQAAGPPQSGTAGLAPEWPPHLKGDIGFMVIQTADQTGIAVPDGWAVVLTSGVGTVGAAGSVGLTLLWKRAASSDEPNLSIPDVGNHMLAQIFTFRGCIETGSPFDGSTGTTLSTAATAVSFSNITTSLANTAVVQIVAHGISSLVGQVESDEWTSALASFVPRRQTNTDQGVGGGFALATGVKAAAGTMTTPTTTVLLDDSKQVLATVALRPPLASAGGVEMTLDDLPWRPFFSGRIDRANPDADAGELTLDLRDVMCDVLDTWMEPTINAGFTLPESEIVELLGGLLGSMAFLLGYPVSRVDLNNSPWPFVTIGDPNMHVTGFTVDPGPTLLLLREIGLLNGWDLRGRWGTSEQGPDTYVLTYYEPDRGLTGFQYMLPIDRQYALRALTKDRSEVRNVVEVTPASIAVNDADRVPVKVSDALSILKYGRAYLGISEDAKSRIRTVAQATVLANAILSDTKEPKVMADVETPFLPFVEINDVIKLPANGLQHDTDLVVSVSGYTHTITPEGAVTVLRTRDLPAAANREWRALPQKMEFFSSRNPSGDAPEGAEWTVIPGLP